mgnify:FL=1
MEGTQEIKRAGQEFFRYIFNQQREFQNIVSTHKSREELECRLGEHHDKHKWNMFIQQCKNLVRWRSEKKSASV